MLGFGLLVIIPLTLAIFLGTSSDGSDSSNGNNSDQNGDNKQDEQKDGQNNDQENGQKDEQKEQKIIGVSTLPAIQIKPISMHS